MSSLLNSERPPVFCPGCSHENITHALDGALQKLALCGTEVVIVSDIGCSGLFDVFFHTHAFHGLHGRALTYALGLKMAKPELNVIVTMGDGGTGIGGAHILSACRRNADITLLVLNNFNFGMTGGQFSSTTPAEAATSSRFLNQLEKPLEICEVADAAGAPFIMRCSGLHDDLADNIAKAIAFKGFSIMDIWGICPGRYTRKNRISPKLIAEKIASLTPYTGVVVHNQRQEYSQAYLEYGKTLDRVKPPIQLPKTFEPPIQEKCEILVLGSAGQRIVTAGELLCLAAHTGGLRVTQKNDYDITVLKGPSVSEIIFWPGDIGYTGIESPRVILALAEEGVQRRRALFSRTTEDSLIIHASNVEIPDCRGTKIGVDFKTKSISSQNWALASLAVLAGQERIIKPSMLKTAVQTRFAGKQADQAESILARMWD